jgi:hypothetical protein
MIQILNSKTYLDFPNLEINYDKEVELFIDSFQGFDEKKKSFKILYVKEMEAISKFREHAIKNKNMFDAIITYDEEILEKCSNSYFLEFGTSWIKDYNFPEKKFQISHLTGYKLYAKGHHLRHKIHYKQDSIKTPKDFYVSRESFGLENFNNNKILGDKKEPLFDSQFHICIENSQQKNCFTEKIIDCFQTKTIPIYWGCPNIGDWFNINGIYFVNDFNEIISICNSLNEKSYYDKIEFINENYELSKKYVNIVDRLEIVIKKILNEKH